MNTLLRRRLMFSSGATPTEGTPYIRGGGDGSYIDTGITPDDTTKIIIWARNWNPAGASYSWLFGSRVANQDSMFGLNLMNNANTGKVRVCFGSVNTDLSNKWTLMSHYHKYELSGDGFYVDDTLVSSITAATFSNNYNIHLLGCNNGGERINGIVDTDIVACKIYKGGSLVRDFTAVKAPSIGLYDAVSDTVFTNAGSGSFVFGMFDPDAYTPLEYITGAGSQYFDTGIYGTYPLRIVCKCRPTSGAQFHELLGYRASTSSCCIGFGNSSAANTRVYWRFGANETVYYPLNNEAGSQTNKDLVIIKSNDSLSVYKDAAQIGTTKSSGAGSSFQTDGTLYVGRTHNHTNSPFIGRIYHVGFGSSQNYVPAKVNDVAGMYDTYNDVFKPSMTSTPFTAGSTI